jgi:anti-anti-sigma factor
VPSRLGVRGIGRREKAGDSPPLQLSATMAMQLRPCLKSCSREDAMGIRFEDVNGDFRRIVLSGRLDTAGSEEISRQFAELTLTSKAVVVHLAEVRFLSSMAIGMLLKGAKTVQKMGGGLALHVGENEVVIRTLDATGIKELIPTFEDARDAEKAVLK